MRTIALSGERASRLRHRADPEGRPLPLLEDILPELRQEAGEVEEVGLASRGGNDCLDRNTKEREREEQDEAPEG